MSVPVSSAYPSLYPVNGGLPGDAASPYPALPPPLLPLLPALPPLTGGGGGDGMPPLPANFSFPSQYPSASPPPLSASSLPSLYPSNGTTAAGAASPYPAPNALPPPLTASLPPLSSSLPSQYPTAASALPPPVAEVAKPPPRLPPTAIPAYSFATDAAQCTRCKQWRALPFDRHPDVLSASSPAEAEAILARLRGPIADVRAKRADELTRWRNTWHCAMLDAATASTAGGSDTAATATSSSSSSSSQMTDAPTAVAATPSSAAAATAATAASGCPPVPAAEKPPIERTIIAGAPPMDGIPRAFKPPFMFHRLGIPTFDEKVYAKYYEQAGWTVHETVALLNCVRHFGTDSKASSAIAADQMLSVRHSNPAECDQRFIWMELQASLYGAVTPFHAFGSTLPPALPAGGAFSGAAFGAAGLNVPSRPAAPTDALPVVIGSKRKPKTATKRKKKAGWDDEASSQSDKHSSSDEASDVEEDGARVKREMQRADRPSRRSRGGSRGGNELVGDTLRKLGRAPKAPKPTASAVRRKTNIDSEGEEDYVQGGGRRSQPARSSGRLKSKPSMSFADHDPDDDDFLNPDFIDEGPKQPEFKIDKILTFRERKVYEGEEEASAAATAASAAKEGLGGISTKGKPLPRKSAAAMAFQTALATAAAAAAEAAAKKLPPLPLIPAASPTAASTAAVAMTDAKPESAKAEPPLPAVKLEPTSAAGGDSSMSDAAAVKPESIKLEDAKPTLTAMSDSAPSLPPALPPALPALPLMPAFAQLPLLPLIPPTPSSSGLALPLPLPPLLPGAPLVVGADGKTNAAPPPPPLKPLPTKRFHTPKEQSKVDEQARIENEWFTDASGRRFRLITEWYIKPEGWAYLHADWYTKLTMYEQYGVKHTDDKLKRYALKAPEIDAHNAEWFDGSPFDPRFTQVDRVIAHQIQTVNTADDKLAIGRPKGDGTSAIDLYFVKWLGLSYKDCTWETAIDVADEMKIAEFRSFNHIPVGKEKPFPRDEARIEQWYKESPTYKSNNTLRDYQVQGVNWLIKNYYQGRNSLLADEMGLGKTVQAIAFLEHLHREQNIRGPFLILVPLSTLYFWRTIAETWTNFNCVLYHDGEGGSRAREIIREHEWHYPGNSKLMKFNILVTSYELFIQDLQYLAPIKWKYMVIDEGHRLKNRGAKLSEALTHVQCPARLLMTGTPLQNNISELFALLSFISPDVFHNEDDFMEKFGTLSTHKQVEMLQDAIRPYMLRRLKDIVDKSIPAKAETIIDVELTTLQKKVYRAIYYDNKAYLTKGLSKANMPRLVNVEMELRKVCNHPFLVPGVEQRELGVNPTEPSVYFKSVIESSGKMVLLDKLLPKLKADGHRVLIFSQMRKVLDLLEEYVKYKKYSYERLDGQVIGTQRLKAMERFNEKDSNRFLFLLTTRAGGQGLNLATADTVIIYDSDWNPQSDIQAQARVHRIGQTKEVTIYRLITHNTYEAQMFERASKKLGLDHAVLTGLEADNEGAGSLEAEARKNIDEMLKKGAYGMLDDDTTAKKFLEADIDTLLSERSRTIIHKKATDVDNGSQNAATITDEKGQIISLATIGSSAPTPLLPAPSPTASSSSAAAAAGGLSASDPRSKLGSTTKMRFQSEKADASLDIDDPEFWNRVLPLSDAERFTADALLAALTDRSALATTETRDAFYGRVATRTKKTILDKAKSIPTPEIDTIIQLLIQMSNLSAFSASQRGQTEQWLAQLEVRQPRRARAAAAGNFLSVEARRAASVRGGGAARGRSRGGTPAAAGGMYRASSLMDKEVDGYDASDAAAIRSALAEDGAEHMLDSIAVRKLAPSLIPLDAEDDDYDASKDKKRKDADDDLDGEADGGGTGRKRSNPFGGKKSVFNQTVCDICHISGALLQCDDECLRLFHLSCAGLSGEPPATESWSCNDCTNDTHKCFQCGKTASEEEPKSGFQRCSIAHCGRFYHISCAKSIEMTHYFAGSTDSFRCALHYCTICKKEGDSQSLLQCQTCPKAMHMKCVDAGARLTRLTRKGIFCEDCTARQSATDAGRLAIESARQTLQEPAIRARMKIKKKKKPRRTAASAAAGGATPTAADGKPKRGRRAKGEGKDSKSETKKSNELIRYRPAKTGSSYAVRVTLDAEPVFDSVDKLPAPLVLAPVGRRQYPKRAIDGESKRQRTIRLEAEAAAESESDGLGEFVSTDPDSASESEIPDSSDDEKAASAVAPTPTAADGTSAEATAAAAAVATGDEAGDGDSKKRKRKDEPATPLSASNKRVKPAVEREPYPVPVTGTSRVALHVASAPASSEQRRANKAKLRAEKLRRREWKRKHKSERAIRRALKAVRRQTIEDDRKPTKAALARAAKRKVAEPTLTPEQVDALLLEFGFLYRKADDSAPAPISALAIAAGIKPPKHYAAGELVPVNWCRFCGARASARWQSGPWGPKTLCTVHYTASEVKQTLDLSPWSTYEPTEPIDVGSNTEMDYVHYLARSKLPRPAAPPPPTPKPRKGKKSKAAAAAAAADEDGGDSKATGDGEGGDGGGDDDDDGDDAGDDDFAPSKKGKTRKRAPAKSKAKPTVLKLSLATAAVPAFRLARPTSAATPTATATPTAATAADGTPAEVADPDAGGAEADGAEPDAADDGGDADANANGDRDGDGDEDEDDDDGEGGWKEADE